MRYTERLEKGIRFAARKHNGQMRKDSNPLPYFTHLMSVAVLISNATDDEDIILAGLLHDTLEDTETNGGELMEHFGERVLELVWAVTLEREVNGVPLDWHEQRERAFMRMQDAAPEALYVAMADKIHNSLSRILAHTSGDEDVLKKFNAKRADYIAHNEKMLALARERIGDNYLTMLLEDLTRQEKEL